jgi:hypothetical protein
MIIFPDSNLPPQSEEWAEKVEKEVTRLDKKVGGSGKNGQAGNSGPAGLNGAQGEQGIQGETGAEGPQGDQGIQGETGPEGPQGETGAQGETGPQGEQGFQGETGAIGINFRGAWNSETNYVDNDAVFYGGSTWFALGDPAVGEVPSGTSDNWFPLAIQGGTGPQGGQGLDGIQGIEGPTGPQGDQGIRGIQGDQGTQGVQGDTGPKGDTGAAGATGAKGDKGDQGFTGLSAYQVAQEDGFSGTEQEWLDSLIGADGDEGAAGADGSSTSYHLYEVNTSSSTPPPLAGYFKYSNVTTQIDSTELYLHKVNSDVVDISIFIDLLSVSDKVIIQSSDNSDDNQSWLITGDLIEYTDYYTIPIEYISSNGTGTTNFSDNRQTSVIFIRAGDPGPKGDDGLSAYDLAVAAGFVGTEAQWLQSLKANGRPVISDSTPSSSEQNRFWWDNAKGQLYLYYDGYWVEAVTGTSGPVGPSGPAGSANVKGIATLDFGAGSVSTETVITGYSQIASDTVIMVSMRIAATSEHTVDDLLTDPIRVAVKDLVVGVGFTIDGRMDNAEANGTYQVNWLIT